MFDFHWQSHLCNVPRKYVGNYYRFVSEDFSKRFFSDYIINWFFQDSIQLNFTAKNWEINQFMFFFSGLYLDKCRFNYNKILIFSTQLFFFFCNRNFAIKSDLAELWELYYIEFYKLQRKVFNSCFYLQRKKIWIISSLILSLVFFCRLWRF